MQQYITDEQGDRQIVSTTETTEATPKAEPSNEPTREQLLAAYEGRYKQAILDSAEADAGTTASTNYSYLLQAEGLSVLTEEDLIAYSGNGERPLYLATPAGSGDAEGIDLAASSPANATAEPEDGDDEVTAGSCPLLSGFEEDLLDELRQMDGALTMAEAAPHAGASMDALTGAGHPENGRAFYRAHRSHTLLAHAGATAADLDKAANRAEADLIGETFEGMLATADAAASKLVARLAHLGGSSSLEGTVGSLLDLGHPREAVRAVIAELHHRGEVRISVRGAAPRDGQRDRRARFISLTTAEDGALANAAKRYADDCREIPARRAEAKALRIKDGQDKGFVASLVGFGEQNLDPIEQRRALFVERAKAHYRDSSGNHIGPRGVSEVKLELAGFRSQQTGKTYKAEEHTLYSATAEADSPGDFFRARVKGRILNGLSKAGGLTARTIISTIFPERAEEILAFTAEGRAMSPQLAEPYDLFSAAARELIEEGKVRHTGKAFVTADPGEDRLPTAAELTAEHHATTEWADEEPDPEPESGPDPSGADRYASDMAGAHDHRAIATGPQAPARSPKARKKAAGRVSRMIEEARGADGAAENATRASLGAEANQAWRQALAVYMDSLGEAARLELHLQINGPQRFERMVEAASEPDAVFRAARALLDEGRITAEKADGGTCIEAATDHDRDELTRSLLRVMARGEVAVPQGTRLARRVRATKAAITRESGGTSVGEQSAA